MIRLNKIVMTVISIIRDLLMLILIGIDFVLFLFNGISNLCLAYLMPKPEEQQWYHLIHLSKHKKFHAFAKGMSPKVNVQLEVKLAYWKATV